MMDRLLPAAPGTLVYYRLDSPSGGVSALPPGYALDLFEPTATRLYDGDDPAAPPLAMYLFWRVVSRGGYRIAYVRKGGAIVHTTHILGPSLRFPFMARGDLHIGPCHTIADERGQGLFPATLAAVAARYPGRRLWMLVDATNSASRRGMEKAGSTAVGEGRKRYGRYIIERGYPA